MSSCQRPPLYQAGSFGARWIMRPPVAHRHRVGEDAVRAVHRLQDVLHRQVAQRLVPVDRGQLLRQVERLRGANQVVLRRVPREHRPHLVLLAVEPGDEEHLHGAAAIPVALLVVRADPTDSRAETLHVHRREAGMALRRHRHLLFRRRRAAGRPHFAVGPGLRLHPVEHVVAVGHRRARGCRSSPPRRSVRARSGRRRRSRASPR